MTNVPLWFARYRTLAVVAGLAAVSACPAEAGLFIAKGNHLSMLTYTPNSQEAQWLYGLSREVSAGVTYKRLLEDGQGRETTTLQVNRLVHRWMTPKAVGNLYVYANAGAATRSLPAMAPHALHPAMVAMPGSRDRSSVVAAGVWADYETRQFYSRLSASRWRSNDFQHTLTTAQLGLSPIRAEYDEIAPWLVIQFERKRGFSTVTQVTPMARFIYKAWWVEVGGSTNRTNRGDLYLNVMHTF
jgi:hypothetical protein